MTNPGIFNLVDAGPVSVVEALVELGGVASRATLIQATSRVGVESAIKDGDIVRHARGRYSLASTGDALRLAHSLTGVLSYTSAAIAHGWEVKLVPERPHVTVPKNRKVPGSVAGVQVHRANLLPEDIDGPATNTEVTLAQCLRSLPFDEALAIADSALRHGVAPNTLRRIAITARGPGSAQMARVVHEANAEAANPFESVLRAIALDIPGLAVRPQVYLPGTNMRPDLVDEDLRIVLEADSFAWHGDLAALKKDARRYNLMVRQGWLVLRFVWEDVMFDQDHVRETLIAVVKERTEGHVCGCPAA